jgi:uncharacterized protein (DUF58 family)
MHLADGIDRKYLRLKDLQRLQSFVFSPRRALEGQYAGQHPTPQRGQSVEFRDFRQYMPGDEVGDVDWKVYGRTDKLYVRIYEHETELAVTILVDASASMAYRGNTADSKFDQACRLAGAIGFVVSNQQDRVALGYCRDGLTGFKRKSSSLSHLIGMLDSMEQQLPSGRAQLPRAIQQVAGSMGRGQILIVISDLWDDHGAILKAASQVTHRGSEVIVFHVLHEDELQLPSASDALFIDSESGQRIRLNVDDIRSTYESKMQLRLTAWERSCRMADIDYHLLTTSKPYHEALEKYLCRRTSAM